MKDPIPSHNPVAPSCDRLHTFNLTGRDSNRKKNHETAWVRDNQDKGVIMKKIIACFIAMCGFLPGCPAPEETYYSFKEPLVVKVNFKVDGVCMTPILIRAMSNYSDPWSNEGHQFIHIGGPRLNRNPVSMNLDGFNHAYVNQEDCSLIITHNPDVDLTYIGYISNYGKDFIPLTILARNMCTNEEFQIQGDFPTFDSSTIPACKKMLDGWTKGEKSYEAECVAAIPNTINAEFTPERTIDWDQFPDWADYDYTICEGREYFVFDPMMVKIDLKNDGICPRPLMVTMKTYYDTIHDNYSFEPLLFFDHTTGLTRFDANLADTEFQDHDNCTIYLSHPPRVSEYWNVTNFQDDYIYMTIHAQNPCTLEEYHVEKRFYVFDMTSIPACVAMLNGWLPGEEGIVDECLAAIPDTQVADYTTATDFDWSQFFQWEYWRDHYDCSEFR